MAALQRNPTFRCHTIKPEVLLPCDENLYHNNTIPEPFSMAQFDAQVYDDEDRPFSSFTYRIDAVRILARVLAVAWTHEVHEDHMKAIDNAITAWFHHLPDGQEQIDMLDFNDRTDELLFQAHMLINYATMYLHFPRSDLVPALPAARDVIREKFLLPTSSQHMHALKPISASKCLDSLASYPPSVRKHSPFFICCVVFSIIVQLSSCAANLPDSYDKHWDQIKLIMVVLKTLGRIWGLARATLKKIKRMTVEVFHDVATYPEDQIDDSRDSGIGVSDTSVEIQLGELPRIDMLYWAGYEPT
ncbi:hypothetical protein RU639_006436 [Aspergillus parasiticus]